MPSDSSVIADPASGAAIVAGTRVAMAAAANGALRFGGPGGRVLRPLTFGERTELVSAASASPVARDAVAAAILTAATVDHGPGVMSLMEVLAMWLAGAAFDAPDFMETTLLVSRAAAWPPHELFAAPAREVDRLAVGLDEQRRATEWKSLVFADPPAGTVEAVRARFADRLLSRSVAAMVHEESAEERGIDKSLAVSASPQRQATPFAASHGAVWSAAAKLPLSKAVALLPHSRPEAGASLAHSGSAERSDADASPAHDKPSARGVTESVGARRVLKAAALLVPPSRPEAGVSLGHDKPSARGVTESGGRTPLLKAAALVPHFRSESVASLVQPGSAARSGADVSVMHAERVAQAVTESSGGQRMRNGGGTPAFHNEDEKRESLRNESEGRESLRFEARPHVTAPHAEDLAATLAALLDDEADLRGVER
jgi:hypothetical protein